MPALGLPDRHVSTGQLLKHAADQRDAAYTRDIDILTLSSLSALRYFCILLRVLESDLLLSLPMNVPSAVVLMVASASSTTQVASGAKPLLTRSQEVLNFPSFNQGLHGGIGNFTDLHRSCLTWTTRPAVILWRKGSKNWLAQVMLDVAYLGGRSNES